MSSLFSKSAIRQAISSFQGHDLSREIAIVQELYDDFRKGNMKDETRYEQNFNELFFHQLLGYDPKINLHPKASTPVGSKIADVGLGFFEDGLYSYEGVKVVVELKGCDTLLDKKQASYGGQSPVDQGFGYKTSFKDCPWLIVSNFASVRLYRDNKQDFEVWTIEDLANPDNEYYNLKTLLGLLKRNHLISQSGTSFSEKLLSEVRINQETITKKFYKEYKTLRFELINDIRYLNPHIDVETVVEKAQKIIDRIIFIHFCEDKGLLPEGKLKTNVIRAREADFSPWDVLKKYFKGVDSGSDKLEIPHGYNGGLFHTDPVLNDLEIGDAICHKFIDLGNYSFDDELSVNILGHIFEQSISDIEQLKGELLGEEITTDELVEKKESKRKKDGIFYTPEYIVDYIVQNSLMKYLEEKETACLEKVGKKGGYKTEIEAYQAYQHILQNIKVLDPACGSGAFLVKVFDYLYAENKRVGQIVKSLFDDDEIYKSILRNNIYGVDLNPESVEITKLSLWLKSAQKGKKLNNLDDNIKCGNSLIDDPAVAGDRAFDRNKEFSDIMGTGGFDVIVGNPPYVISTNFNSEEKRYFEKKYKSALYQINLYLLFIELGIHLGKDKSKTSYIVPNTWLINQTLKDFREYIIENYFFESIVDLTKNKVFIDATVLPIIFNIIKEKKSNYEVKINYFNGGNFNVKNLLSKSEIKNQNYFINYQTSGALANIFNKIEYKKKQLGEIANITFGVKFYQVNKGNPKQTKEIVERKPFSHLSKINESCKMVLEGKNIDKYSLVFGGNRIEYGDWLAEPRTKNMFEGERILVRRIVDQTFRAVYINEDYCNNSLLHTVKIFNNKFNSKYILSILNSKLLAFYFVGKYARDENTFPEIRVSELKQLPIPEIPLSEQQPFIDKADLMLSLNKELQDKTDSFLRYISSKFGLEKLSTKLQKFYDYDFATFLKELKGAKLSMSEEAELMEFFETKKSEIVSLKNRIDVTDSEIDEMVFELYGLSEEERRVVLDS